MTFGRSVVGLDESARTFIEAIELEVSNLKKGITYVRSALLVALAALSSLFWSVSETIGAYQFGIDILLNTAPFIVAAVLFVLCSLITTIAYYDKAGWRTEAEEDSEEETDVMPHDLVFGALALTGAIMSCVTIIDHCLPLDSLYSAAGVVVFGGSFLFLAGLGLSFISNSLTRKVYELTMMLGARLIRSAKKLETRTSSPDAKRLTQALEDSLARKRDSESWRRMFAAAVLLAAAGVACMVIGWHFNDRAIFISLGIQLTGVAALLTYALDQLNTSIELAVSVDVLEKERRTVVTDALHDSKYAQLYGKLMEEDAFHQSRL